MSQFAAAVKKFVKEEDAPTVVEYALLLGLLSIVSIVVIASLGTSVKTAFSTSNDALIANPVAVPTP